MIIGALCDYYDILAADPKSGLTSKEYETTKFAYEAVIDKDGNLMALNSFGKEPKSSVMPKTMRIAIANPTPTPVCDKMSYLFGVDFKNSNGSVTKGNARFNASKEFHINLFASATSKEAAAIKSFFEKWDAENIPQTVSEHLKAGIEPQGNVAFRLENETDYFHEYKEIRGIWLAENAKRNGENDAKRGAVVAQCAVLGEVLPVERVHEKISGVGKDQRSLVSFKPDSFQSYNLDQSYNSRISEKAALKYTKALNYLLASKDNRMIIGDDRAVFWASSQNKAYEQTAFGLLFGFEENASGSDKNEVDRQAEEQIKAILKQGKKGVYENPELDPDVKFCVLGLAPNVGRISVRYFYQNSFAEFCDKIKQYYDETQVCGNLPNIKIGSLIFTTISSNSRDKKPNPLLGGAIMRVVLSGGDYPQLLLNQIILRVKAEIQVTQARAAAIKAYLMRNKKEEISPMLNEQSTNPAYVLGRTFAILERIQYFANNAVTIRDSYFGAACSNPVTAFPKLLKLAQHHLSKVGKESPGLKINLDKELGGCLSVIESNFPKSQNLEQQGMFILGYYQQKNKKEEGTENESGSN